MTQLKLGQGSGKSSHGVSGSLDGPATTTTKRKEDKPKVKIEAPLEDLADLIQGAILGNDETVEVQDQQEQLPLIQASIPETLPQNFTLEDSAGYTPTNVPMQASKEQSIFDRLKSTLDNPPLQSDYKPSKLRRIGGAIAGGLTGAAFGPEAGYKTSSDIVSAPYRESYQDWITKTGALEKGVNIDLKRAELALAQRKASSEDFDDYLNYQKYLSENDPEFQAQLAGGKAGAVAEAEQPFKEASADIDLRNKLILADVETAREKLIEQIRQTGRNEITDKEIKSREMIATQAVNSSQNIAKLRRDLDEKIEENKNARIPLSEQNLSKYLAEDEISKTVVDPDEFGALFEDITDSNGTVTGRRLKPRSSIDSNWIEEYNLREEQIDKLKGDISNKAFPKSSNANRVNNPAQPRYKVQEIK